MAAKPRKNFWGWTNDSLLARALNVKPGATGRPAQVLVHMGKTAAVPKNWQGLFHSPGEASPIRVADHADGYRILCTPRAAPEPETDSRLQNSLSTRVRDAMGTLVSTLERLDVSEVEIGFDMPEDNLQAAILGLEMASYRFKRQLSGEAPRFALKLAHKGKPLALKAVSDALALAQGVNLARHLVNLPPNELNPVSYADFLVNLFKGIKNVRVEVWDEKELAKERMALHLAVGQGSDSPPRLVHIRYRPSTGAKLEPIALVGKGITFDTGGLDIKPASGMRLMKKDMGGSAAVAGLAYWAAHAEIKQPLDFYLALAENSIGGNSFRPSDVITARNGLTVEIHNTDAEGRLVLADALDVAVTAKEKPRTVVNVATLTGAIKTALGAGLAGLFSNDNKLAAALAAAGQVSGDPMWGMPLVQRYKSTFSTPFADLVNSTDGFGGAITAALFLERFVGDVPWAHLDIYAWKDSAEGACLETGGSGQAVCALAAWLSTQPKKM